MYIEKYMKNRKNDKGIVTNLNLQISKYSGPEGVDKPLTFQTWNI